VCEAREPVCSHPSGRKHRVHGEGRCLVHLSEWQAAWAAAGIVLAKEGGALGKMLPVFNIFAGGPLGTGRQWCSWIHRRAPPARHVRMCGCLLHASVSKQEAQQLQERCKGDFCWSGVSVCQQHTWRSRACPAPPQTHRVRRIRCLHRKEALGCQQTGSNPCRIRAGPRPRARPRRDDLVNLYISALTQPAFSGVYNATAPNPVRMTELCSALGSTLGRPSWIPVPAFALAVRAPPAARPAGVHTLRVRRPARRHRPEALRDWCSPPCSVTQAAQPRNDARPAAAHSHCADGSDARRMHPVRLAQRCQQALRRSSTVLAAPRSQGALPERRVGRCECGCELACQASAISGPARGGADAAGRRRERGARGPARAAQARGRRGVPLPVQPCRAGAGQHLSVV